MLESTPAYQDYTQVKSNIVQVESYATTYCSASILDILNQMYPMVDEFWNKICYYVSNVYHAILSAQQCIHKTIIDPDKVTKLHQHLTHKAHDVINNNKTLRQTNKILTQSLDKFKAGESACDTINSAYNTIKQGLDKIRQLISDILERFINLADAINHALQEAASVINCVETAVFDNDTMYTLMQLDPNKYHFVKSIIDAKQSADNASNALYNASSVIDNYTSATNQVNYMIGKITSLEI